MKSAILKSPLPCLALLAAHLIWGANTVIAKITLHEFPVMSLSFIRFALAALILLPFLLKYDRKQLKIKKQHFLKLVWVGLLWTTFSIGFGYQGLTLTTAIDASVLSLTIPIISVLISWWFLKDKIYIINLLGVAASLAGALAIIGVPIILSGNLADSNLLGNGLIILAGISGVIGSIMAQKLFKIYPVVFITWFAFLVGAITFAVPAGLDYYHNPAWMSQVTLLGLLGLLFIIILSSVCAYFLYSWGLEKTNVVQSNLFQYLEPAVTATLAVPLLQERISFSFIIGTCLVVLGVYWGTFGKPHHHHPHFKHHRF